MMVNNRFPNVSHVPVLFFLQWIQLNPVEMFDSSQADLPLYPGSKPWVPGPPAVSIQSIIHQTMLVQSASMQIAATKI